MHSICLLNQFGRRFAGQSVRFLSIFFVGTFVELHYLVVVLHHADEEGMNRLPPIRLRGFGDRDSRPASLLCLAHRGNETLISVPLPKLITAVRWTCRRGIQTGLALIRAHVLRNFEKTNRQVRRASTNHFCPVGPAGIGRKRTDIRPSPRKYPRIRFPRKIVRSL